MWSVVVTIENLFFTALADEFNVKSVDCFFFYIWYSIALQFQKEFPDFGFWYPQLTYWKKLVQGNGKFKDEACGVPITEFVGLRSKMYSFTENNDKGSKTAKGINKNVIKKDIGHGDHKNVLFCDEQNSS